MNSLIDVGDAADVVIVGAGLAGLTAARQCVANGLSVRVLEARERVGGRVWSQVMGRATFDRGGQWIGPGQERMYRLVQEFALRTFRTFHDGRKVLEMRGRVSTYKSAIPRLSPLALLRFQVLCNKLQRLSEQVPRAHPWRAARAAEWDATTMADFARRETFMTSVHELLQPGIRTVMGADAGELSLLNFLHYIRSSGSLMAMIEIDDGLQQDRIVGGAQQIAERLAEAVGNERITLGTPVQTIDWRGDHVHVCSDSERYPGRAVIVAVPLTLCQRIRFVPTLPSLRTQLMQRVPMGATVKVLALYERPFWRERGYSGEAVHTDGPVSIVFDNSSANGEQAALVGFVVGSPARGWSERPEAVRRQRVLDAFKRWFGPEASAPTLYEETDWATEEWAGGCPVASFPPGTLSVFGPALRAPIGPIFWAGTETARESTGYMEGAVESGERAAAEVLTALTS